MGDTRCPVLASIVRESRVSSDCMRPVAKRSRSTRSPLILSHVETRSHERGTRGPMINQARRMIELNVLHSCINGKLSCVQARSFL